MKRDGNILNTEAHKSRAIAKRGLDKPTSKPLWQRREHKE